MFRSRTETSRFRLIERRALSNLGIYGIHSGPSFHCHHDAARQGQAPAQEHHHHRAVGPAFCDEGRTPQRGAGGGFSPTARQRCHHPLAHAGRRRRGKEALFQRLRQLVHPASARRGVPHLSGHHRPLAVVSQPHRGLPHLSRGHGQPARGNDRPGYHQKSLQGPWFRRRDSRAHGDLPQTRPLRTIPRDRLQLRQPPHGAGGHLLLL